MPSHRPSRAARVLLVVLSLAALPTSVALAQEQPEYLLTRKQTKEKDRKPKCVPVKRKEPIVRWRAALPGELQERRA